MIDKSQTNNLKEVFAGIPLHPDNMRALVEMLDNGKSFACYSDGDQHHMFCEMYTIRLLQKYVYSEDEREILFVAFRLLDGYDQIEKVGKRRELYAKQTFGINKLVKCTWKKPDNSLYKLEVKIIEKLTDRLIKAVTDNPESKGWLGLADIVVDELSEQFPNGLPKKIPLPKPRCKEQDTTEIAVDLGEDIGPDEPPPPKSPPVSPLDTPPKSWVKFLAKLKEFVPALSPKRKAACLVCLCAVFFLFVYVVIQLGFPQGETGTGQNQGTLDDIFRMITDEDMDIIIESAQAPIGIYQGNGEYSLEDMVAQVKNRVLENPVYGDMVARGLIGIDAATRGSLRENNPWLQEFVEKTDAAMSSSESGQAGMQRWLTKSNKTPTTTDEYKDYADKLCLLLDYFSAERVDTLTITQQWCIDPDTSGIYARAEESAEQTSQNALILVHQQADGKIGYMIGFAIENGSIMICDPWKLGLDTLTS